MNKYNFRCANGHLFDQYTIKDKKIYHPEWGSGYGYNPEIIREYVCPVCGTNKIQYIQRNYEKGNHHDYVN